MQNLEEWIRELRTCNKLIIVEGKKDRSALLKLGIKKVVILNKPIYKLTEEISKKNKECILLVDLDSEGKKLYSKLKHSLQRSKVKIDTKFREFLFKHTTLTQIEGLTTYLNTHQTPSQLIRIMSK